ncbi:dihydrodipicolinate synthase family protein [Streptomyces pluripotens]|uniref:Dihydrodipicolinate synthase family protein n=1 Tax=Streptomyces pluripotens TaxID=1355015 RepID=A0A221NWP5_9ACTN|nr:MULTISPECIES: dihydrodipicolinate synthase family protein [Streptomyces]ARP70132.1 dihydrodipicolinate synthase family protein [Streptomyces pluripotens]ASN24391.1 dihydrodipicolinate synthase family protein [Streptomyces pluripotens]KIE25204.1 glucose dehydrogenase [Streptomyces sp. MUSC 125]
MTFPAPLTGVVPPVCTPLTPEREVDVPSLLRLVDHLVEAGVHGLFLLGSTSEAAFLTDRQRRQVVEAVTAHVGGQLPLLAGALDMTTPRVLDHVSAVTAAGAQGVVVTAPFYVRTHHAEIVHHYRRIAAASRVPVIAYDIPTAVHSKLPADLVLGLAGDGVLAGIKDSSSDLAAFRAVVTGARAHPGFSVLTGSELIADAALALGADGAVPGLANVDPHGYVRLYRRSRAGDWEGARAEQERLCALSGLTEVADPGRMGDSSSALGAFKAALHLRGVIDCPVTAEPQVPLSGDEVEKVGRFLVAAGLS